MIVIDIGHGRKDKGAYNVELLLSEWDWNKDVADALIAKVPDSIIVERISGITQLISDINKQKPEFCLSLHCNAADRPMATGTECLYYHTSVKSKVCAEILQKNLVGCLQLPDRGIKPKTEEDRGGTQLRKVSCPIVIVEPFFLSNKSDVSKANSVWDEYINSMVLSLEEIRKYLKG